MKRIFQIVFAVFCVCGAAAQKSDSTLTFTLTQAVELARLQSPSVQYARHSFRSKYWNYVYYKANYLPSLNFSSSPTFNNTISLITQPDGTQKYMAQNQFTADANLYISQNFAPTGGTFTVQTNLQRYDQLKDKTYSYSSSPIIITYSQSLLGYNDLKWDRRIEPINFEVAKRNYVEALELVAESATNYFFNLATAQTTLDIARTNLADADTLYIFAQGRYNMGVITENDMLQLEVRKLAAESNWLKAQLAVDDAMESLRSFLGIKDDIAIQVKIDDEIPLEQVDMEKAVQLAIENSPDILALRANLLSADASVASAKGNAGLKADLYMRLGLGKNADRLQDAYVNPQKQQLVQIGLSLPILDWGRTKGKVQMARSSRDLVYMQAEQSRADFEQRLVKLVKQFNLQHRQIEVAEKTDATAQRRGELARRLYMLGQSTILELNSSISEQDNARMSYISALETYWSMYYSIRSLTLFDFEKNIPLTEDYKALIK